MPGESLPCTSAENLPMGNCSKPLCRSLLKDCYVPQQLLQVSGETGGWTCMSWPRARRGRCCFWDWANARDIWLVSFGQSLPGTAALMSCQPPSAASCCCWFETVLQSGCSFVQLLLLCLAPLLGLCTCSFAFLCSLPVRFVTFPEQLSLWHLYGCPVGGCWALGTSRAD